MLSVESKRDLFLGVLVWNGVQTDLCLIREEKGKCYVLKLDLIESNGWKGSSVHNKLPKKFYDFYDEFGGGTDKSKLEEDLIKAGYLR